MIERRGGTPDLLALCCEKIMGEPPLLCSRELEKEKEALGLKYLASQLSSGQTIVSFATTGSTGTEWPSAFSQQWAPPNK